MRRPLRILMWTTAVCALAAITALAFAAWMIATTAGSNWLLQRALRRLPGSVEATVADGSLVGPLTLEAIRYAASPDDGAAPGVAAPSRPRLDSAPQAEGSLQVTMERMEIDWQPTELLRRRLWIDSIVVTRLSVDLPASDEPIELIDVRLPIPVRLASLVLDDTRIRIGDGPPTDVEQLSLSATADDDTIELQRFAGAALETTVTGSGTITTCGDYELDLRLDWTFAVNGESTLAGGGDVGGNLQELRIDQRLVSPLEVPVRGKVLTPLDKPAFEFTAQLNEIDPQAVDATLPALRLNGTVDFRGIADDYRLVADIDLDGAGSPEGEFAQGRWRLDGHGTLSRFVLDRLEVGLSGGEVRATGDLSWDADLAWALEVTAAAVDPAVLFPDWPGQISFSGSTAGHLSADGPSLSATVTELAGQLRGDPIHGNFKMRLDGGLLSLDQLQIALREGELRATGELSRDPDLAWDLQVSATAVDPSTLFPEWPGQIDFSGSTSGTLHTDGPRFSATIPELAGQLRGHPLHGALEVAVEPGSVHLERLELTSREARLEASGRLDKAWDLIWSFTTDDLDAVYPGVQGSLQAEGTIIGPRSTPHTRFQVVGRGLAFDDLAIELLEVGANLDLSAGGPFQFTAVAERLSRAASTIDDLHLELDGTRDSHQLDLTVTGPTGVLRGSVRGDLEGNLEAVDALAWSGQLARLDFDLGELGDWRLQTPMSLFADRDGVDLGHACWRSSSAGSACFQSAWSAADGWSSSGSLDSLPLPLVERVLPEKLRLDGTLTADYSASGDAEGRLRLDLTAAATGNATLIDDEIAAISRPFTARISSARVDASGVHILADLSIVKSQVDLVASIPGYQALAMPPGGQQVEGSLIGRVQDISPLEPFLLGVSDLQGSLDLDSRFSGPISAPRFEGTAILRAAMRLPTLGITLEKMELIATGSSSGRLDLAGVLQSADGAALQISGSTPTLSKPDSPAILRLKGDRFQIVDLPEARIWISPDLEISAAPDRVHVSGQILLPRADLELAQQQRSAVTVSEDVVVVGGPIATTAVGTKTSADLRVTLGDAVEVRGDGFQASLGGGLRIQQQPGRPTADGTLLVRRGSYRGYNQDLRIEDGKILYSGGRVDNPALDIAAFRRARDGVVAGIRLRGNLDAPHVSLYSTPPMPEAEVLSYIMRGKASSPGMANDMTEAATSLGLAQSTSVLNSLGLKNVSVESDGTIDETALVLGTYLAPNFYVSYGVGLFEAVNTLRMRYEFSDRWMIETDTSEEGSGADLSFTFEK